MSNKNLYVVHLFDSQSFEAVITMTFDKTNKPFAQLKKIKIYFKILNIDLKIVFHVWSTIQFQI